MGSPLWLATVLIVGIIASVRRMPVITMDSSQTQESGMTALEAQELFNASMIELCVLERVDIHFVQMNALTTASIDMKALGVCS